VSGGSLSYPRLTRGSVERRKLVQRGLGGAPAANDFGRNFMRFYMLNFNALWKLAVRDINTKSTKNITGIGKVTLHIWTSN